MKIKLTAVSLIILSLITQCAFAQNSWEFGASKSLVESRYFLDARVDYETMQLYLGNLQGEGDALVTPFETRGVLFSIYDENMNSLLIILGATPAKQVISVEVKLALEGYNDTAGIYKIGDSWGIGYKRDGVEILGPILGSYEYKNYLTLNPAGEIGFGTYSSLGFASGSQAINLDIGYIYSSSDIFTFPPNSLPFGLGYRERLSSGVILGGKVIPYVCFDDGSWGVNINTNLGLDKFSINIGLDYYKNELSYAGSLIIDLSDTKHIALRLNSGSAGIAYGESF